MRSRKLFGLPRTAQQVRFQSSSAMAPATKAPSVFSIRSTGYGPSGDVLKGVPPYTHLSLTTKAPLHPEDARIQKEVLALAMPSLSGVTVQSKPRHSTYAPASLPLPLSDSQAPSSHVSAAMMAELDLRMQMLEINVQEQLANVANLVVDRVAARTGHQLSTLEASQAEHAQTLAQLIVNCIHAELRASGGRAGDAADHANLAEQVALRVAHVLEAVEQLPGAPDRKASPGAPLDSRIEQYFAKLEKKMKEVVVSGEAGLSSAASKQILKAMDQAFRVQEDSIRDVVKSLAPSGADSQRELEEFIEGSLRTAADNIRLHITAELKKQNKASPRRSGAIGDEDAGPAATGQLEERLQQLADGAADMAAAVTRVDEVAADIFKEQAELKALLTTALRSDTFNAAPTHSQPPHADTAKEDDAELIRSVAELKSLMWRVNSTLEVNQGKQETMLLDMAQSISASVAGSVTHSPAGAPAIVSDSVEAVLKSNMTELLEKVDAAERAVDERMSGIASVVSDTVRDTLSEWWSNHAHATSTSMTTLNLASTHHATSASDAGEQGDLRTTADAASSPSTESLRDALVAAVQNEMSKTHEVNLTPMYQYVDSILAFLKEELAQQSTHMTTQLEGIRSTLATAPAPDSATLASLQSKLDQLLQRTSAHDAPALERQLEAMETSAKQRNQELLEAIKSSPTLDGAFAQQLRAIEASLKSEGASVSTANTVANSKLEALALAVAEQRAVLDRIRDAQVQDESKARLTSGAEPLSPAQREQWHVLQEKRSTRIEKISSLVRTLDRTPRERLGPLAINLTAELSALYTLEQQEKALTEAVTAPRPDGDAAASDPFAQLELALSRVATDLSSSQSRIAEDVLAAIGRLPGTLTGEQLQEKLDAVSGALLKAQASHLDAELVKHSSRMEASLQDALSQWKTGMAKHQEKVIITSDMARASHEAARASSSRQQPWLWVALNAIVVGATVMLCVYYIAACALVALVPKTTRPPSGDHSSPAPDVTAAATKKTPTNPKRKPLPLADDVM